MNKLTKLAAAIALASGAFATAPAMADVSATAGFVTEYYFRGSKLGDAAAYGSVDYSAGGFYAGVWAINYDVDSTSNNDGNAVEYDIYAGYALEFESGVSVDFSVIQYEYTDTVDSETDLSLTVGFNGFSANYSDISDDNPDDQDYDGKAYSFSWEGEVFGATYGHVEFDETGSGLNDDEENDWVELSASGEVVGLDVTLVAGSKINVDKKDGSSEASSDGYIFLDISKSFDL